jgi:hypothetical protein
MRCPSLAPSRQLAQCSDMSSIVDTSEAVELARPWETSKQGDKGSGCASTNRSQSRPKVVAPVFNKRHKAENCSPLPPDLNL